MAFQTIDFDAYVALALGFALTWPPAQLSNLHLSAGDADRCAGARASVGVAIITLPSGGGGAVFAGGSGGNTSKPH